MNQGIYPLSSPISELELDVYNEIKEFDHFLSGLATSGNIGKLAWTLGAGSITFPTTNAYHPGVLRISSGTTANVRGRISLINSGNTPVIHNIFRIYAIFRVGAIPSNGSQRIGLFSSINSTNETSHGLYLSRLVADTNWHLIARDSGTTRINTGKPIVNDSWLLLDVRLTGELDNTNRFIEVYLNENLVFSGDVILPTSSIEIGCVAETNNTTAKTLDIDLFGLTIKTKTPNTQSNVYD